MPQWVALAGLISWNYARHRRGLSTLCSAGRTRIGPVTFIVGWLGLSSWLLPHYCGPFWRDRATRVNTPS